MGISNDFRVDRDGDWDLETLAKRIKWQLKQRGFCVVFENDVERYWPNEKSKPSERLNQIEAFAKSRGWKASILNTEMGDTRVIFEVR
jgi:hypothetical protein